MASATVKPYNDPMKDLETSDEVIAGAEAETFRIVAGRRDAGLVILCDHASNAFPPGYGTLGLPASELTRHITYDIGAAAVVEGVARALGVPAVLSRYSRLLIDLNRGDDDPTLIMRLSDGAVIPGNRLLPAEERAHRLDRFWRPYHDAVDSVLDACLDAGVPPAILSVHSFTEAWKGKPRPWHVGVLWDQDTRLVTPLLAALAAERDLVVGDNQPYTGRLVGDCMWQHGTMRGLAHAIVEIRQDLIRTSTGQAAWTARLTRLMQGILGNPALQSQFRRIAQPGIDGSGSRPAVA